MNRRKALSTVKLCTLEFAIYTYQRLLLPQSCRQYESEAGIKRKRDTKTKKLDSSRPNAVALTLANPIISGKIESGENCFFSPLSLQIVLATTVAGSNGKNRDELLSFLKFDTVDQLHSFFSKCADSVLADGSPLDGVNLRSANAVWIDQSLSFASHFKDVLTNVYKSHANQADFRDKKTRRGEAIKEVNAWAKEETKGLVKDFLKPKDIDEYTRLIFLNAIYFKGAWERKFSPSLTKKHKFYLLDGSTVEAPFMTSTERKYISAYRGFKVLRLPYRQGKDVDRNFSMYWYLPTAKDGLPGLVEKMSFDFEAIGILKDLGLVRPFVHGGFKDMVDPPGGDGLRIPSIFQKCFIEVNEKGTEAAAVTRFVALSVRKTSYKTIKFCC
ncbi:OLC1v1007181C1 [Oldenlandia corymbosa var. corymbosa]|uniref:OLC1v1007181C1 n=1 Tax=Oldenlandia corymbosa var. corymbosa TaxID=529605 RepID=A0AAV1DK81_OLDCO|nr:OLC1v1007181C1 [Oldenlandia corymbosa var. corymbosa]